MRRWIMLLWVLGVLIVPCRAQENDMWMDLGADTLTRAAEQYGVDGQAGMEDGMSHFAQTAGKLLPEVLRQAAAGGLALLVTVLLCGIAQAVWQEKRPDGLSAVSVAGALAITGLSAADMTALLGLGRVTVDQMHSFGQVLVPIMAACTAASGSAGAAAAGQMATTLFSTVLIGIIDSVLVPVVYAYIAVCTACTAVGNPGLKKVAELLKWVVTTTLTTLLLAFMAYHTFSASAAGHADAAALKATKMAISTAVPVVGRIISDAAETILVGAGAVRGTVGVLGVLTILGICLLPFLQLGCHYLVYKFCAALCATVADSKLSELIGSIGTAFGLVLGMAGTCALLLLVSTMSVMAGVGL